MPQQPSSKKQKVQAKGARYSDSNHNGVGLPKLFRPKRLFSFAELIILFRSCFKETEEERTGQYSMINKNLLSMDDDMPLTDVSFSIDNCFETLLKTVEQTFEPHRKSTLNSKNQELSPKDHFPFVENKYFVSFYSRSEKTNVHELSCLLKVLEFNCFSILTAINSNHDDGVGFMVADQALAAKVFIRHMLCLSLALEKYDMNTKQEAITETWQSSVCSCLDLLNDLVERKLVRHSSCLEVLRFVIPRTLKFFSSFGKKQTRIIWNCAESLLVQILVLSSNYDEHDEDFEELSENQNHQPAIYSTCMLVFNMVKDNLIEPQNACNWVLRAHENDPELLFHILTYLLSYCKERLEGKSEKKTKKSDVTSVVEVISLVAKSHPHIMNLFVSDMDFLISPNGTLRKLLLEVLASCSYKGNDLVNLTCLNFIISRTQDKDGFVRAKAFQILSEIGGNVSWVGSNQQLFSFVLDAACNHVFDKTKIVRIAAIDCLTSFVTNNPFSRKFPQSTILEGEKTDHEESDEKPQTLVEHSGCKNSHLNELFVPKMVFELIPKLVESLRFVLGSGPLFCKESVVSIFKLLNVLKRYNIYCNWSMLIELVHPGISDFALNEIANFFASDFLKDPTWTFLTENLTEKYQSRTVWAWGQLLKTLKDKNKQIQFDAVIEKCNQNNTDAKSLMKMLVLCNVDIRFCKLFNISNILSFLESSFDGEIGHDPKIAMCIKLVEVLISTDSSLLKWAEEFVEKFIIDLLLTYPDEMVSLIFSLPNGRRTAYYGVGKVESALWQAWSSDNAVSSHRMISFCKIVGDVCYRSCQEIKTCAIKKFNENADSMDLDDDEIAESETDNCLKETQKEQTKNMLIQKAIDETMINGFLSRYVLLLRNILNSKTSKYVKSFAVLALGKVFLVCRSLASEIYADVIGCLKSIYTATDHHLICSCLVVLADSFTVLPTEAEDNNDLLLKYVKHDNKIVADTAKRLVQDLFTRKKCKASLQSQTWNLKE